MESSGELIIPQTNCVMLPLVKKTTLEEKCEKVTERERGGGGKSGRQTVMADSI